MKRMKNVAALALALVCLATLLTGCGGQKKSDSELIVGTWETAVDVSELMHALVTAWDEGFAEADFAGLGLPYQFVFSADGTYTAAVPADGTDRMLRDTAARMASVMKEQKRRELAQQQNVNPEDIDDDQLSGYVGMIGYGTWEDMCLDVLKTRVFTADAARTFEMWTRAGRYALKDGKLLLSEDPDKEPDENSRSAAYKVDENSLTLTDPADGDMPESAVFSRVTGDGKN